MAVACGGEEGEVAAVASVSAAAAEGSGGVTSTVGGSRALPLMLRARGKGVLSGP